MYKILVVENNQEILRGYIDTVNTLFPNQITITSAENQTDALSKLNNPNNDYVGAIIDLRLDATETDGSGGNEVLRQIKQNLRFPIFVLSGHTEDLEDSIVSKEPLFNIREKNTTEGDFATIVNRIIAINKTGITNILSRNGQIETWLKDIFWTHLAPIMPYWITAAENDNNIEKSLLRYISAHLQEYLEQTEHGDFENYHAIEFYIAPPIKNNHFTGDVVKDSNDTYHVILTPACDFANNKAQNIVLAEIEKPDMEEVQISQEILNSSNNTSGEKKAARKKIEALKCNTYALKYHYLPPIKDIFDGGYVNFQKIQSVPLSDLSNYALHLSISQSFKKDIIARFSHYYARQGQPSIM